jgi:hypothetical protein
MHVSKSAFVHFFVGSGRGARLHVTQQVSTSNTLFLSASAAHSPNESIEALQVSFCSTVHFGAFWTLQLKQQPSRFGFSPAAQAAGAAHSLITDLVHLTLSNAFGRQEGQPSVPFDGLTPWAQSEIAVINSLVHFTFLVGLLVFSFAPSAQRTKQNRAIEVIFMVWVVGETYVDIFCVSPEVRNEIE